MTYFKDISIITI